MSLRLRAFAVIMLIAVTATAATAWLTLRQASKQVRQSLAADQQETMRITGELRGYGSSHGTWQGVEAVVVRLAHDTGQRIRAETDTGQVVADSDLLAGRSSRAVIGAPVSVSARPMVRLAASEPSSLLFRKTVMAIIRYRTNVPYAVCLTQAGVPFSARPAADGVLEIDAGRDAASTCSRSTPREADLRVDNAAVRACTRKAANQMSSCMVQVFAQRTAAVGPPPLLVYLGAVGEPSAPLPIGRTVALASARAARSQLWRRRPRSCSAAECSGRCARSSRPRTGSARVTCRSACRSPGTTISRNSAGPSTEWPTPCRLARTASAG